MALSKEYVRKVEHYINCLQKRIYSPQGQFGYSGFFTYDRLSYQEALAHEKQPLTDGLHWGKKWEYAWLFTQITIPSECRGQRVVFTAQPGECLVFVNGQIYGAFDRDHTHITLTQNAQGGETYDIAMEVYAGHSAEDLLAKTHTTFVDSPKALEEFPEDVTQKVLQKGCFGIQYESVFGLWMDMYTLYDLYKSLDGQPVSLRHAAIAKGLRRVCDTVDIELPLEEFLPAVQKGRGILKPLFEAKNGTTTPTMYAIGHSHLDLEWLWTTEETRRKTARTLGNQLQIIKEYPEYKYLQSQAWILDTVKREYPDLYKEVQQAVKEGNILVEGGAWVEPDCNITSGESLVRQFIFGKRFFAEEFGVDSKIFWLPDSFGITGALPQILKGCDIPYFFNAKLNWLYNDGEVFPYSNFTWEGIDGSKVFANIIIGYGNPFVSPHMVRRKWEQSPEREREDIPVRLFPYGNSDGGGGATRRHLEVVTRLYDCEGVPKIIHESPVKLYDYITENCDIAHKYVGELYYACHRGTYTSQAKTKKLNRLCELTLRDTELWSAVLAQNTKVATDELWKTVLFNQFHDILPGSSITAVHEIGEKELTGVLNTSENILDEVLSSVVDAEEDTITVFNSLSWARSTYVALPQGYTSVTNAEGIPCPTQTVDGKTYALLNAPAVGYAAYRLGKQTAVQVAPKADLVLENEYLKAEFNGKGELLHLVDKTTGTECLQGASNVFKLYGDAPTFSDAWDIDSFYEQNEVALEDGVAVPEYQGQLYSSIVITKKLHNSTLRQRVSLKQGNRHLDFETEIEWNETHKLLKVDFNTNMHTEELLSDIQFGYIKRPNHKNHQYDADRFEVWQHKWSALCEAKRGVALLNDCKYGISAAGGKMSLTLLKSAAEPALNADKGHQVFTYALMPFSGSFTDSDVAQQAYEFNIPMQMVPGHKDTDSLLQISEKNVILETVKLAEDGSGDLILRLYESKNTYTPCKLTFGFAVKEAYITNMLEKNENKAEVTDNTIDLTLKAFQVVTLRIKR